VVEYFTESDEFLSTLIVYDHEMILIYVVPYRKKFSRGLIFMDKWLSAKIRPVKYV
jgi:hypothetical protein